LQRAERTVLYVRRLSYIHSALRPVVVGLNAIGNRPLSLIGIRRKEVDGERYHTTEERNTSSRRARKAACFEESRAGFSGAFELAISRRARLRCRVALTGIEVGTGPDELSEIVRRSPHTRYPIYPAI
jgi:CBS domain containing-hemolysin-like protein